MTSAYTTFEKEKGERYKIELPDYVDDDALSLTENQRKVLEKRYLRRNADGTPLETHAGMFYRVARIVAEVDEKLPVAEYFDEKTQQYISDVDMRTREFYDMLSNFEFLPNSPTFTGAGTPLGQLAACFVLPVSDDMGGDPDGIFSTLRVAALIQQTGGGNGFDFSSIRPKGDAVQTSSGRATGPLGVLHVYDQSFGEIAQGGTRRGANMGVLRIDHPDIEEFIKCKSEEGSITNFNISVAVTDDFMKAVEDDADFDLVNPRDGAVWKTVRARELFDMIVEYAHNNGEPGILFIDRANDDNPVPGLYRLVATNPCGEQWLGPYENCCLGSVNLAKHWKIDDEGNFQVDWEKLANTIKKSTHFLDNVISANKYVPAIPIIAQSAYRTRRIGLGIMGLADLMYRLGIRYGSVEGQAFSSYIMEWLRFNCMVYSVDLAYHRGAFPACQESVYSIKEGKMMWEPPSGNIFAKGVEGHGFWGRPEINWRSISGGIATHGIRNSVQTTIAPTGTIATVSGCEGYGCEPVFALGYVRHFNDEGVDVELEYTSPLFMEALIRLDLPSETISDITRQIVQTGSCQNIEELPAEFRKVFATSSDITAQEHVAMQAALQTFVDNSISKTCNFPETATVEDVRKAYISAWRLECKGLTVYVAGSRDKVVLETKETREKKQADDTPVVVVEPEVVIPPVSTDKRRRPDVLTGTSYRKETPLGTAYVTINHDESGDPFEVFVNVGKAGSSVSAISESLGRMVSLILRMPSSQSPRGRLQWIVEDLENIGGENSRGFGAKRVRSLPDGIAQVITEHISGSSDETATQPGINETGDLCPSCGSISLLYTEGCKKCFLCGFSLC